MSHSNKVHSRGNVPFSWEKKPGVSKGATRSEYIDHGDHGLGLDDGEYCEQACATKLPPPPVGPGVMLLGSSSGRGTRKHGEEDPFLAAFHVCTKSRSTRGKSSRVSRSDFMSGLRDFLAAVPCKGPGSCGVREGTSVKVSRQLH